MHRMRILLLFLFFVFSLMPTRVNGKVTDCGLKKVNVEFSAQSDAEIACEGIRRAELFYADYGYAPSRQVHIRMLDRAIFNSADSTR